ncbi:MAG: T9SS C-terminal target domain-containing protein [Bacteroidetes bacterium]|nr:MAG: T9SS C-terminal target domain-containing protein [Bacteroidota bacterium]
MRGQGNENFSNIGASATYGTRTWTGSGGTWTATDAREDQTINLKAITIRNGSLTSPNVSNGIGNLTITTQLKFSGTSGNFDVFINGTNVGTLPYSSTATTTTISNINISGSIQIVLTNQSSSNRVAIDDVIWTSYNTSFTSTLSAGAGTEPSSFSSLINTQASSTLNFDFTFTDDGATPATDATDTQISQIIFNQGTGNTITDWTQAIAGAELSDGTNATTSATINTTNITFASLPNTSGTIGRIVDNATKTYTLKIWLKTALGGTLPTTIDGLNFVFQVTNSNFTFVAGGLATAQSANSGSTNNIVSVVATQMSFTQQPPSNTLVGAAMSPSVLVQATDANGNRDLSYTNNISITSTGTLNSSPQTSSASSGLASFGSIIHNVIGLNFTLTASASGFINIISASFNITNVSGTFLNSGDLVIIGFDAQETGSGAEDGVYFMNMIDILPNTTFSYVNSRFEACAPANTRTMRWGGSGDNPYEDPGIIKFTWTGTTITKGSVIKMRAETSVSSIIMEINGVDKTSDFTISSPSISFPNISSSSPDQLYVVQGDFTAYGTTNVDRYNLFSGRVLFGFTNGANWVPFSSSVSCNTNGTGREGRLHPDLRCFNIETSIREDAMYYKTTAGLQIGTKRQLLGLIKDDGTNWTKGITSIPSSRKTTTFTINTGKSDGTWVGDISQNWFDCANWEGLTVPNNTIDVVVETYSPYTNRANIDFNATFSDEFQDIAQCKNLLITDKSVSLEGNINSRLDVYSNITISGTGQIDMNDNNNTTNDGTINLYGNFTNQLTNGLDEGNGTFNFIGLTEQTINNTNGNEGFYRINVNKTSNDVKLLSNINLTSYSSTNNGQITLTQNDINLNGNNIDLGSLGTLNENLANNHLIKDNTATFDKGASAGVSGGYVRTSAKTITTSNNTMSGIGLNLSRATGSDYSVEVDRYHYSAWSNTRTLKRVFHVKTTSGTESGSNSNLKMFFANDELNGLNNGADGTLTAWRLPTGSPNGWAYHPVASVAHSAAARTIEATSVNAFSHWAMTPPNIPLSSCILDFQAQKTEPTIAKLTWKVILQDSPQKFEIQKSFDGINFIHIATIDANLSPNYTIDDYQLLQSSYYRLKIFKTSGETELSPIRYVRVENGLIIYPNPVGNFIKIEGKNLGTCTMKLFEVSGKNLLDNRGSLSQINEVLNQYLPNLPKGMYFLQINTDQQRFVHKLIKE